MELYQYDISLKQFQQKSIKYLKLIYKATFSILSHPYDNYHQGIWLLIPKFETYIITHVNSSKLW